MIQQISASHRTTLMFLQMAQRLTGHAVTKKSRNLLAPIMPIINKLRAGGSRS
jgi:pilus assembly protein CpaE